MKKIFYSTIMLIFCLGLSTTCFGAKSWSESEFETFLEYMGYGAHDFSTFSGNYSTFKSKLNNTSSKLIMRMNESSGDSSFSDSKLLFIYSADSIYFLQGRYDAPYYQLALSTNANNMPYSMILDLENKTITDLSGGYSNKNYLNYLPYNWYFNKYDVTQDELYSTSYKTLLFNSACVFSDVSVINTDYIPQGGRLTSSSYEDLIYSGSISYGNTTKIATINYTEGFEENTYYDLFLERYQIFSDSDYGLGEYPIEIVDLGTVTTSDSSININVDNWALGSNSVYRLCVGINTFDSLGRNTVFICTDWLLPNSNSLIKFPAFARSHYVQFLELVGYDPSYEDVIEDNPDFDNPFEDVKPLAYISGGTVLNGFIDDINNVNVYVIRKNDTIDIQDFFFILDIYDSETEELLESIILQSDTSINKNIWGNPIDEENLVYFVSISDLYNFDINNSWYYSLRLHSFSKGYMEHTQAFYFDNKLFGSPVIDFFSSLGSTIIGLFVPDKGFFEDYWNDLYDFFSKKLGFLWDVVMFFPEFFNNFMVVVEAQIGNVNFDIPTLSVPDFQGSEVVILKGFNWSFTDYVNQNIELSNLYDLYLDLIDFFVGIALVGYALSVIASIFEIQTPEAAGSGEGLKVEGK